MSNWTDQQWTAFTGLAIAGLSAVGLLIVALRIIRGWTAPAVYRLAGAPPSPRPTVTLTEQRRAVAVRHAPALAIAAGYDEQFGEVGEHGAAWAYDVSGELRIIRDVPAVPFKPLDPRSIDPEYLATVAVPIEHDPMKIDYTEPGIGALTSLQAEPDDETLRTPSEIAAAEHAWIHAYDDGAAAIVERFERRALARVDAAVAELLADLPGRDLLDAWRIDAPTGEYRVILPLSSDVRATAEALLVAL